MGAGSSVEEIPGGGTEGYHVLRVRIARHLYYHQFTASDIANHIPRAKKKPFVISTFKALDLFVIYIAPLLNAKNPVPGVY